MVPTPSDAEDVTAVVFLETWRRRTDVRIVEGSLLPWMLVTATNVGRNHTRALRRYGEAIRRMPARSDEPDIADGIADREILGSRTRAVNQAFLSLSAGDQTILALCVLEELSVAQASAALRIPQGTVKSRLSRARARLAQAVSTNAELAPSEGTLS